jgi:methylmalonyl-CoA epimerase
MIKKIDHIGIVVENLEKAIVAYTEGMGLEVKHIEESEEFNVKIAFLPVGEVLIELIEPTGLGMAQEFLNEHGEGMHHICYRVQNLEESLDKIGKKLKLKDEKPRPGGAGSRVAFLDPESTFNVTVELVERENDLF